MASVLPAARAGQVESEASETIRRFVRRRAWLGPNPGLPPHLGSLSLTATRAHHCYARATDRTRRHARRRRDPSPEPHTQKEKSHTECRLKDSRRLPRVGFRPFRRVPLEPLRHVRLATSFPALVALRRLFGVFRGAFQKFFAKEVRVEKLLAALAPLEVLLRLDVEPDARVAALAHIFILEGDRACGVCATREAAAHDAPSGVGLAARAREVDEVLIQ